METSRADHASETLADGRVLLTGGRTAGGGILKSAELYDPETGSFGPTGPLSIARYRHTATRLESGKVLIVGGLAPAGTGFDGSLASTELYEPSKGVFTPTGATTRPRSPTR